MSGNPLNLDGFGRTEVIILLVVLFILFGHHLPSLMRALGRGPRL
jgi:Sec-independent protein translocase protein TatA